MTDTRARLLDAGIALLHELGVRPGVAHVRLAEVAHRAGYTPSAAYRCWDNQADFHRDLAAASLAWRDRSLIADTTRMVRAMISAQAPWQEVLRVGGNSNVHRTPEAVEFYTALALRAAVGTDPTFARGRGPSRRRGTARPQRALRDPPRGLRTRGTTAVHHRSHRARSSVRWPTASQCRMSPARTIRTSTATTSATTSDETGHCSPACWRSSSIG